jgi:N-glycosylase/DNA lyase
MVSEAYLKGVKSDLYNGEKEFYRLCQEFSKFMSPSGANITRQQRLAVIEKARKYVKKLENCDASITDDERELAKFLR